MSAGVSELLLEAYIEEDKVLSTDLAQLSGQRHASACMTQKLLKGTCYAMPGNSTMETKAGVDLDRDQHNQGDDDAQQERLLPVADTEVQDFGEKASRVCWLHACVAW